MYGSIQEQKIKYINFIGTKNIFNTRQVSRYLLKYYEQTFIKPWIEHVRKERELKGHLISGVLNHAQNDMVGRMLKDDGTPDKDAIKRFTYLSCFSYLLVKNNNPLVDDIFTIY